MQADVCKALGDAVKGYDQRIALQQRALTLREQLLATDPANRQEQAAVASLHQRIGQLLEDRSEIPGKADEYPAALEHFNKALAIYRNLLRAEPNNSRHRRNVADITAARIRPLANLRNKTEAMKDYRAAMKIFEELATADPKDAEARLDIAYTQQIMCRSFLKLDDPASALKSCRAGLSNADSILAGDPTNIEVRRYVYTTSRLVADALKKAGNIDAALKTDEQLLVTVEQWLAIEPRSLLFRSYVADIRTGIAEMYVVIASNAKNSTARKKENWLIARDWFTRSLDAWRDLQTQNALPENKSDIVNKLELEITRCDAALGQ